MAEIKNIDFDCEIEIQRATYTTNSLNEKIPAWSKLETVPAKRQDASASEGYRAQEVGAEISRRFTIHWSPEVADVTPLDRVLFNGLPEEITAVRDRGRNEWREIDTVARAEKVA